MSMSRRSRDVRPNTGWRMASPHGVVRAVRARCSGGCQLLRRTSVARASADSQPAGFVAGNPRRRPRPCGEPSGAKTYRQASAGACRSPAPGNQSTSSGSSPRPAGTADWLAELRIDASISILIDCAIHAARRAIASAPSGAEAARPRGRLRRFAPILATSARYLLNFQPSPAGSV